MGADTFEERVVGFATAQQAFSSVVKEARYLYGHGGYTGTIAEKSGFIMINVPVGEDPIKYAESIMEGDGPDKCHDKWGPACCVTFVTKEGEMGFYFFGWASS